MLKDDVDFACGVGGFEICRVWWFLGPVFGRFDWLNSDCGYRGRHAVSFERRSRT